MDRCPNEVVTTIRMSTVPGRECQEFATECYPDIHIEKVIDAIDCVLAPAIKRRAVARLFTILRRLLLARSNRGVFVIESFGATLSSFLTLFTPSMPFATVAALVFCAAFSTDPFNVRHRLRTSTLIVGLRDRSLLNRLPAS
jgi:hypothetical protein